MDSGPANVKALSSGPHLLVTARGFLIPFRKLGKCEKTRKGKSGQGRAGEGGALVTSFAEYVYRFQWMTYFL